MFIYIREGDFVQGGLCPGFAVVIKPRHMSISLRPNIVYNIMICSAVVYSRQLGWCGKVPTAVSGLGWYLAITAPLTREA